MKISNKEGEKKATETFTVQGDWEKQSKALKTNYPKLTTEDVKFETGKESDLLKRLESKLGKDRKEVISILKTNYKACS